MVIESEITELKIEPLTGGDPVGGRFKELAVCIATLNNNMVIHGIRVREGKDGIFVKWPLLIDFTDKEARKKQDNRILATWVINHCMDDYTL